MLKKSISLLAVVLLVVCLFYHHTNAQLTGFNRIEFAIDSNEIHHFEHDRLVYTYHAQREIGGENVQLPVSIYNGRSFVSLDFFYKSEILTTFYTYELEFISATNQVRMNLYPDNDHSSFVNKYLSISTDSDLVFINNEEHYLDTPVPNTNKTNNTAYFPIRFIFETFGCKVDWDNDRRVVIVHLPQ